MWNLSRAGQVISTGAAAVVLCVSVAACGVDNIFAPKEGCTIEAVNGDLVKQGGRTAISNSAWLGQGGWDGPLVWPDGWSLRTVDDNTLEVVDPSGVARARTGTRITIWPVSDDAYPMMMLGQLIVCPRHTFGENQPG